MKMKKQKIVFVNQSSGYLMVDIVNAFVESEKFKQIAIITGESKRLEGLNQQVVISHIVSYKKNNVRQRLLSWMIGTIQTLFIILWKYRGYHLFLASNPPTVSFLTLCCRNPYSTLVYDVFPEGLVLGGFISRTSLINKLWSRFNNRFYHKAQHVFTITEGMAKVIQTYCPNVTVKVIPVWHEIFKGVPDEKNANKFITLLGLQHKFIVMYSGNMGKVHDIDVLVHVADALKKDKDIVFIFIGEGWKKTIIMELIQEMNLDNCMVLPYQTVEMLPHSLSAADISVVSVPDSAVNVCLPSKIYNLISLGVPVLGIAEKNAEIVKLIEKYDFGASFSKDNTKGIIDFVSMMKNNADVKMKYQNNAKVASRHFSPENAHEFVKTFDSTNDGSQSIKNV